MSLITVDESKCNRDGICVRECPIVLLTQEDEKSIPEAADNADKMCLHCGHCVAVCPSGALSLSDIDVDDCLPIKKELKINIETVEQFFRSRRSIRNFKDNVASKETIEKLIQSGHIRPNTRRRREKLMR